MVAPIAHLRGWDVRDPATGNSMRRQPGGWPSRPGRTSTTIRFYTAIGKARPSCA
jgi:hypothetical protein